MSGLDSMFFGASACLIFAVAAVTYTLLSTPPVAVSVQGPRGYARQRARENSWFSLGEPILRVLAAWMALLPLAPLRQGADSLLQEAGNFLGLTADEFLAGSLAFSVLGALASMQVLPGLWFIGALGGATLPYLLVGGRRQQRTQSITRDLPNTMELIALCVSSGMNLDNAMREVLRDTQGGESPLQDELRWVLRDIDLGHSRRKALTALSDRTKGEGISDFVASVIQSEERGNPLGEVLASQARVLRLRRSFRAEEMANKAAIQMVIPLAMLMLIILTLIITPLLLDLKAQGL